VEQLHWVAVTLGRDPIFSLPPRLSGPAPSGKITLLPRPCHLLAPRHVRTRPHFSCAYTYAAVPPA
jgi:hypothetical protein